MPCNHRYNSISMDLLKWYHRILCVLGNCYTTESHPESHTGGSLEDSRQGRQSWAMPLILYWRIVAKDSTAELHSQPHGVHYFHIFPACVCTMYNTCTYYICIIYVMYLMYMYIHIYNQKEYSTFYFIAGIANKSSNNTLLIILCKSEV